MARGRDNRTQITFNGGELSETVSSRVDLEKYLTGGLVMENGSLNKQGELEKRPGTDYIAQCKFGNVQCRLISFEFSRTTAFCLEFGNQYIRFFDASTDAAITAPTTGTSGTIPYEIATPYLYGDLFELQYRQINDVMYIVHPDYQPRKLSRLASNNWTLTAIDFAPPAFIDENISDIYITPTFATGGTGAVGEAIRLDAAVPTGSTDDPAIWTQDHIGSYWQVRHLRDASSIEQYLDVGDITSSVLPLIGEWNVRTYGFWGGTLYLEKKGPQDIAYRVIRQWDGDNDRNVDAVPLDGGDGTEASFQLRWDQDVGWSLPSGVTDRPRAVLEATEAFIGGLISISTVDTDGQGADGVIITSIELEEATTYWSEPLWSEVRGWPTTIDIFEDRLILAGSDYRPLNFQASQIGDYENFAYGDGNDDEAWNKRISALTQNPIRWMGSLDGLLMGSSTEVWGNLTEDGAALTPATGSIRRQTSVGSKAIQPVVSDNVLIFVHNSGKRLYELTQDGQSVINRHVANDLTILADHIPGSGITNTDILRDPETKVLAVNLEGELCVLTYERQHNVVGWTRIVTGSVESVAVVAEKVWISVKRNIGSVDIRYIEKFSTVDWEADGQKYAHFVDSAVSYGPGATGTITNITSARPAVVTGDATGLVNGDLIEISGVLGMTEVNSKTLMVKNLSTLGSGDETWELYEEDGTTPYDARIPATYTVIGLAGLGGTGTLQCNPAPGGFPDDTDPTEAFVAGDLITIPTLSGSGTQTVSVISTASGGIEVLTNNTDAITLTFPITLITNEAEGFGSGSVATWKEVYKTLTGLEHLNGQTVQAYSDGAYERDYQVAAGSITLRDPGSYVRVGLPYTMTYKSMRNDASQTAGSTQGQVKRIDEVVIRVESTGVFEYSSDGLSWFDARVNTYADSDWGAATNFVSKDLTLNWPGGYDSEIYIYLRQAFPLPLRIKAITIKYAITGK